MTDACGLFLTLQIHYCSILSEEFMRASLHDAGDLDAVIISQAKERAFDPSNGRLGDVSLAIFWILYLSKPQSGFLIPPL